MSVGSVVFATEQGLGYLAKAFFDNGIIDTVFVQPHSSRTNHYEWYPDRVDNIEKLFSCETLIFFEEVFYWKLIPQARERGIKTILIPMYECTRNPLPYEPDIILTPSDLDQKYFERGERCTIPVDAKWRKRDKALVFVHNAGNGGIGGRNGTKELIDALPFITVPFKLIVRSQIPLKVNDPRVEVRIGTFDDIWSEGDVFVFPEKFNGLSLPLQEAFASGMLVMCGDRFPMNTWLPNEPLIKVDGYKRDKIAVPFDSAIITPREIAKSINLWYNKDIGHYSLLGKEWGNKNNWESLKEFYTKKCEK